MPLNYSHVHEQFCTSKSLTLHASTYKNNVGYVEYQKLELKQSSSHILAWSCSQVVTVSCSSHTLYLPSISRQYIIVAIKALILPTTTYHAMLWFRKESSTIVVLFKAKCGQTYFNTMQRRMSVHREPTHIHILVYTNRNCCLSPHMWVGGKYTVVL